MMNTSQESWATGPITDDTVSRLRNRLHAMKEVFGDCNSDDEDGNGSPVDVAEMAKQQRRKRQRRNCMDTIIDGSLMGMILAVCLAMVLGAAFFAYKNLYFAVMKKMYPERSEL